MVWKIESSEISFTSLEVVERRIQEKETVTSENQAVSAFAFYSVRSHRALLPLYSIQEKQIVKSYPSEKKKIDFHILLKAVVCETTRLLLAHSCNHD